MCGFLFKNSVERVILIALCSISSFSFFQTIPQWIYWFLQLMDIYFSDFNYDEYYEYDHSSICLLVHSGTYIFFLFFGKTRVWTQDFTLTLHLESCPLKFFIETAHIMYTHVSKCKNDAGGIHCDNSKWAYIVHCLDTPAISPPWSSPHPT
jgi:hypothetical protein